MTTAFNFDFTAEKVAKILPNNDQSQEWFEALSSNLPDYDITTIERVAAFMAQTAHESGNYVRLHENLNYKAESLIKVWPTRFDATTAAEYAHKPEDIANCVYSNRCGNGDEDSGDGWNYRGRGLIQLTFKDNYAACSQACFGDDRLLTQPELLETDMDVAIKSACWYWDSRKLNDLADEGDMSSITHKINGGYIGLAERIARYTEILEILKG